MHNRLPLLFKGLCLVFGVLVLVQLSRLAVWQNPLAGVVIPKAPSVDSTNAPAGNTPTNSAFSSNAPMAKTSGTNIVATNSSPTNLLATTTNTSNSTNVTATNLAAAKSAFTNGASTNMASANTNRVEPKAGTNAAYRELTGKPATNAPASNDTTAAGSSVAKRSTGPNVAPPGMPPSARANMPPGRGMPGGMDMGLPLMVQARIEQIIKSEILGMIMRPPPMALLGIAGKDVLFRSPTGQTGLLRVGEEMGGVKLLQIGSNRILIEQDGQKKELTIFEGLGGESLMPK